MARKKKQTGMISGSQVHPIVRAVLAEVYNPPAPRKRKPKRLTRIKMGFFKEIYDSVVNGIPEYRVTRKEGTRQYRRLYRKLSLSQVGLLHQLYMEFCINPTAKNYLEMRRKFPHLDLALAAGGDRVQFLDDELSKEGVAIKYVYDAMTGESTAIDALCLEILKCVALKDELPRAGVNYISRRRNAIKESTVNFLVTLMLDAIEWHPQAIPSSLIFFDTTSALWLGETRPSRAFKEQTKETKFSGPCWTAASRSRRKTSVHKSTQRSCRPPQKHCGSFA